MPETPLQLMAQSGSGPTFGRVAARRASKAVPVVYRRLAPPGPLGRFALAPAEAVLSPPAVLLDRALVFETGKGRSDGASQPGSVCRFNDVLNQRAEFHRLFG